MSSIFHACQFFIKSEHILDVLRRKKWNWIFTQFQLLFHRQADFWTLQRPPESDSWGFHGGIPSSGTQGSPPNHFRKKIISGLKSLTPSPSPLCSVLISLILQKLNSRLRLGWRKSFDSSSKRALKELGKGFNWEKGFKSGDWLKIEESVFFYHNNREKHTQLPEIHWC